MLRQVVRGLAFSLSLMGASGTQAGPAPAAPRNQSQAMADAKSAGCRSCHLSTDAATMHENPAVVLGCTDCHGGEASVFAPKGAPIDSDAYADARKRGHVPPRNEGSWPGGGALGVRSYTDYIRESPEFIRFTNPGDLRIARESCGACHLEIVERNERSLMATGAMFWGGAGYNNGILPNKRYAFGEAYTRDGKPAAIVAADDFVRTPELERRGVLERLDPLPRWETVPMADIFRVFERGGRTISSGFPEIGLPNPEDEPGKPEIRQSNRGPGTGSRISVPILNLHKTRLNDPMLWLPGTADNPGDFRNSGCTACHVIYANDRSEVSSGSYAGHGHWGQTATDDPTIRDRRDASGELERGHPIRHAFTREIPTSQCMTCHHHQANGFMNSYLGFTMWDYEADANLMWPKEQRSPGVSEMRAILDRNPEEAATRGLWSDPEFVSRMVDDVNPKAIDTQFADYHGHGWNFRAVFKRARDGTLLDAVGDAVPDDLAPPEKWKRAVHLQDIHAERGMQCADCHYSQDVHGDGYLYGEMPAAIEVRCRDCHGTVDRRATLASSGPAAPAGGNDFSTLRNADGRRRFVWREGALYQRLILAPHDERRVPQVRDSVDPLHPSYNVRAARAKTVVAGDPNLWGVTAEGCERAHDDEAMSCYACHSSWVTSCAGCHLPIQANWKTERQHYEGGETRNFATYNPQVARDQMFQLGRRGEAKGGIIAPVRSSSALVLSSTDLDRNKIYVQQPPISSSGFSSQAFNAHFPHTVRTTETKTCNDCHASEANDNNAILAQLLLLGTNFVNFLGHNAWVGTEESIEAIQVTEWDEPQAVIGSYLHEKAYPEWYREHEKRDLELRGVAQGRQEGELGGSLSFRSLRRLFQRPWLGEVSDARQSHSSTRARCLQLRGEYLYVAAGKDGMRAYDVANIGHKGQSERIVTAPFSPLGQNTRVDTRDATCVALPTNQPIRPDLTRNERRREANLEQRMHPIYSYVAITDAVEGLILVKVETLSNFEPRDNHLRRSLTWNPEGLLDGALYAHFAGHILYVSASRGVVVVDLDDPLTPRVLAVIPIANPRASMLQFRYLFVTSSKGLEIVDVTHPERPRVVEGATVEIEDARRVFVARTYAYVAAGGDGLVIIDVENPERPIVLEEFDAHGQIKDARDVVVATTNASLFAYIADGAAGLKVVQLTSPELQPKLYGFSPEPNPKLIAWRGTSAPALALSRPLERDRAVDETGHQIAVFGRIGARPFNLEEMQRLYLRDGELFTVSDQISAPFGDRTCPLPNARSSAK